MPHLSAPCSTHRSQPTPRFLAASPLTTGSDTAAGHRRFPTAAPRTVFAGRSPRSSPSHTSEHHRSPKFRIRWGEVAGLPRRTQVSTTAAPRSAIIGKRSPFFPVARQRAPRPGSHLPLAVGPALPHAAPCPPPRSSCSSPTTRGQWDRLESPLAGCTRMRGGGSMEKDNEQELAPLSCDAQAACVRHNLLSLHPGDGKKKITDSLCYSPNGGHARSKPDCQSGPDATKSGSLNTFGYSQGSKLELQVLDKLGHGAE